MTSPEALTDRVRFLSVEQVIATHDTLVDRYGGQPGGEGSGRELRGQRCANAVARGVRGFHTAMRRMISVASLRNALDTPRLLGPIVTSPRSRKASTSR
jgi:hypothetical protein